MIVNEIRDSIKDIVAKYPVKRLQQYHIMCVIMYGVIKLRIGCIS